METVEVDDRHEVIDVTLRVPGRRQRLIICGVIAAQILLFVVAPTGPAVVVGLLVGSWLALVFVDWPRSPDARLAVEREQITAEKRKRRSRQRALLSVNTQFRATASLGPDETIGVTTRPVRVWESDTGEPEKAEMYFVTALESELSIVGYIIDRDEAEQLAEHLNEILRRLRPTSSSR
ncbi:MAG: hypothetical protein AAFO29_05910 [Actinomycetota bacterium]